MGLWQSYYQDVANSYEFRLQSRPKERLQVSPKPVHVYSNPASGFGTHGAFFVWTSRGRAEAIGAIWSKQQRGNTSQRGVHHECQSLSYEPFIANSRRGTRWMPGKPGITPKEIPYAGVPSKVRSVRTARRCENWRASLLGTTHMPRSGSYDSSQVLSTGKKSMKSGKAG